jgi:cholesterol oxidase
MTREIPLYTLEGVQDADISTHYFSTADGLGLSMLRFTRGGDGDAVLVIHGLTTSTDMFIMPEHRNLVTCLLDEGYDVWCLDFRMSNRHSYNLGYHRYTMDDIALYDYPPAIELVRGHIGDRPLHVISHCLGSASFTMSLFGKAVDGISSLVANSVALTPRVPAWSRAKITVAPRLIELCGFQYANPRWSEDPWLTPGKVFSKVVSFFHRECDVPACHMLSLMWGTGWPALYSHENLDERTHRRGGDLYGATSMHYFRHVRKMIQADNTAVKYAPGDPRYAALPDNYFEHAHEIETPVLFTTGENNHVFTDSNVECHRRLRELGCDQHELKVFPGYGHQDPFMGKDVARDVVPHLLDFMSRHRERAPSGVSGDGRPAAAKAPSASPAQAA